MHLRSTQTGKEIKMAQREVKQWITVNGQHIPIFEGQSKQQAIDSALKNQKKVNDEEDKKEKQIKANKKEADKLNNKNKEPKGFSSRAAEYVGGGVDIDREFTKEDLKFISDNSKETDTPLYRVEDAKYNYNKFMKDGEIDGLGGTFRSFTSDKSLFNRTLDEDSDEYAGISNPVIYEVLGKKKSFDMSPYTKEYDKQFGSQHEHLMGGDFEPIKEREEKIAGKKVKIVTLRWVE